MNILSRTLYQRLNLLDCPERFVVAGFGCLEQMFIDIENSFRNLDSSILHPKGPGIGGAMKIEAPMIILCPCKPFVISMGARPYRLINGFEDLILLLYAAVFFFRTA